MLGSTGYMTSVALIGLGLATILRGTAGAITVLVAVVFVLPPLLPLIPLDGVSTAADHFPSSTGSSLMTVDGSGVVDHDGRGPALSDQGVDPAEQGLTSSPASACGACFPASRRSARRLARPARRSTRW